MFEKYRRFFLTPVLVGWLLAVCVTTIAGAAELGDAKAVVDEVVADTSFLIPLTKTPMPFENFRYPYIAADGTVTFIGNDQLTFGADANEGIYQSTPGGKLTALVKQEQISPDDGQPVDGVMGLQTDFKSITFHRGPDRGSGIYGFFNGGPLQMVANTQTRVPGKTLFFKWFWYSDVSGNRVVFNATHEDAGQSINGLYLYHHANVAQNRTLRRLVDNTQSVPAADGAKLTNISYQPRIDPSWLVFSANKTDAQGNAQPGRGILGWRLDAKSGEPDEAMLDISKLQVLAPFDMVIPDSGVRPMTSAPNPVVDQGIVAVMAGNDPKVPFKEYAAYQSLCVRTPDGLWRNPLDTETEIPGRRDKATFSYINKWVAVQDGQVIFRVGGPDDYQAVYIYNVEKDVLYFVADTNRQIDGKTVTDFETSTHPLAGQRLAMMVRFADKTSGEYLATLPGLPVKLKRSTGLVSPLRR